uniref:BPL_C domain-containing protein n=1 Tax=Angiostrongylus cantonensis TaxID=6313 RepID=A0A0K0D8R2_ANGCA
MNDTPIRIPPFPGAAIAYEPSSNSRGSVQFITTDRSLSLPIVSHPSENREVPANTQALLVRTADGVFLRLNNGLLLDAQNTVFDSCNKRPLTIALNPPERLRLPAPLKTVPDVIELD